MPMAKKKRTSPRSSPKVKVDNSFAAFIEQPHIAAALLVFALIALFFSILEFSRAIAY